MGIEQASGITIFAAAGWLGEVEASHNTQKWAGEQAEAAFLNKATSLGLTVSKPWGDSERYDLIVGSGSRLSRVQVKSTAYQHDGRCRYSINAQCVPRRSTRRKRSIFWWSTSCLSISGT